MRTSTDHQLIDPRQLRCPLFLDASSSAPQAIDLTRLNNQVARLLWYLSLPSSMSLTRKSAHEISTVLRWYRQGCLGNDQRQSLRCGTGLIWWCRLMLTMHSFQELYTMAMLHQWVLCRARTWCVVHTAPGPSFRNWTKVQQGYYKTAQSREEVGSHWSFPLVCTVIVCECSFHIRTYTHVYV